MSRTGSRAQNVFRTSWQRQRPPPLQCTLLHGRRVRLTFESTIDVAMASTINSVPYGVQILQKMSDKCPNLMRTVNRNKLWVSYIYIYIYAVYLLRVRPQNVRCVYYTIRDTGRLSFCSEIIRSYLLCSKPYRLIVLCVRVERSIVDDSCVYKLPMINYGFNFGR